MLNQSEQAVRHQTYFSQYRMRDVVIIHSINHRSNALPNFFPVPKLCLGADTAKLSFVQEAELQQ